MKSIFITGCSRGLGLGIIKCIVNKHNPKHVFATCQNINKAEELQEFASKHKNVTVLELELKNFDSYNDVSHKVSEVVGKDGLNVLFNNAGVSPLCTGFNFTKVDQMMETYLINTVAPLMLTKAFLPLLRRSAEANKSVPMGTSKAAIINMSSLLGSVAENDTGDWYPYRCSKAALNIAAKSMAIDLKKYKILVVNMHPGWVRTHMGGPQAPMAIEESVNGVVDTIYNLNEKHNGGFIQYDGSTVAW